ncbi:IS110 family RNA-guided transposase [Geochorda subterranea]|uniref:IS110 family transposase n=1 Tax=Geochorda subterranea TaxID=3109564 RepID=A0ABZ1BV43_9FIRM|nr:IS110 family transposase [Limnochorda sp. LNt]WRP15997.1 IS110 family transposase [Limnochorda sp. LNt]
MSYWRRFCVDPRVMRRLGSRKRKTDHDDAKLWAERLALGTLPGVWVPPKPLRELGALVNLRRRLVEQRARWKNQIRSLLQRYGYRAPRNLWQARRHLKALWELDLSPADRVALAVALEQLRSTNVHLRALEREIGQRVKDYPPVRLLLSLPGFNVITAATYYAYIGDPFRFPTDKHVASYTGLVPRVYQSGTTDRRGSITKEGPAVLRWTLVEAASSVARHGPPALRAFYQRLRAKKGHQVAVVALAAKLARIAWVMWRTGRLLEGIRPELHAAKLSLLDRHAAPYPTAYVLRWLGERVDQILDRSSYAIKHTRKGAQLEAVA